jgi:hypothetical protein
MFKKFVKGAIIGAAALTLAAPVQAADNPDVLVHLFGASAQYKFWTDTAPKFLADQGALGAKCDVTKVFHAKGPGTGNVVNGDEVSNNEKTMSGRDAGAAKGENCQGVGDEVIITYTTFSSAKGVQAVARLASYDGCTTLGEAGLPDVTDLDSDGNAITWGPYPGTPGTVDDLECLFPSMGASDVAATTFGQESHGELKGPNGGGYIDSFANPITLPAGMTNCRPIVVPFAFFGDHDLVIDNLTRLMATSIFSGTVFFWSDLGINQAAVDTDDINVCLRHAGSGTHATLDAAVMRGDAGLMKDEFAPYVYFNKGSSDLMKCIRDVGPGTVGYADADKNGALGNESYQTVKRLKYMGAEGNADTIKNGVYDFWSAQWLYFNQNDPNIDKIDELCAYAAVGANMPASRAGFWAAENDMKVEKATDFEFPTRK